MIKIRIFKIKVGLTLFISVHKAHAVNFTVWNDFAAVKLLVPTWYCQQVRGAQM